MVNKISRKYTFNNDSSGDLSEEFIAWLLMDYTKTAISKVRNKELCAQNITPEQVTILFLLRGRGGSSTIAELAEDWVREPHSISTLTSRMEAKGMVHKIKHPKQKEIEIKITSKGLELLKKIKRESINEIFSTLSSDDIKKLSQYLKLLLIRARGMLGLGLDLPFKM